MKIAIQCGLFAIKFNNCDSMIYYCVTQYLIDLRYLIEIRALHRHSKGNFTSSVFSFRNIEFPMKLIENETKVRLSFGLFWKIYFSKFCIVGRIKKKVDFSLAKCDVNFHNVFHCDMISFAAKHLKKNWSNLFRDLKMCSIKTKNIHREWEQTKE